ncbi:transcriptional regulator with XRE-family HTH domain [Nonomuraea angiospora]|uniref:Transcriptional regulator with XRE-family HTH domain n=1 Tax=Nonomuraea angiospora TaxID=46172 RepID=A0ABR9LWY3_9ACTN|nr:transcriptional regulator with XRE-family HTH domain [Nonomuraea angiospora]
MRRRQLAGALRELREERELSIEQVADQLDWHPTKLSRFETARRAIQPSDVRALLDVYQVDQADRDALLVLAREARQRDWWQAYGQAIPEGFKVYLGLEAAVSSLYIYESEFIPGLVQTEDYIRAVHRATLVDAPDRDIEQRVTVRLTRQKLLTSKEAPKLWLVVNEAVIRRVVGGPDVMRAQLERLLEVTRLPNVTLQVLPFAAGAHPAMDGAFHMLRFEPTDPSVVYIEYHAGTLYLEKAQEVEQYAQKFDHLRATALSVGDSRALIEQVARDLHQ